MAIVVTHPVDAVLLIGPTGSGKSPLGDAIAGKGLLGRKAHHLDFGAELRAVDAGRQDSAAYTEEEREFIRGVLERGLLLENKHFVLAEKIIGLFLDRIGFRQDHLLVLNGIPRHIGQARDIAETAGIQAVIQLHSSAQDILRRIRKNTGGDRTRRADDGVSLIAEKLRIFKERTAPLIDHYAGAGCRIYRIPVGGSSTTDEAYARLSALAAADPPIALVAEPPER